MQVLAVKDKATKKEFHKVARKIYDGDPCWVPVPELLIDNIFNLKKSFSYKSSNSACWILKDDNGELLGRIAAFINGSKAYTYKQPTGGIGYFECVNSEKASRALFDTAREWMQEQGMEAIDGPVNFGENLINWGLLVDGFMQQGFGMPYNKPYYLKLFRQYGFEVYFEQYSYHLDMSKPFPERFWKIAEWVAQKPNYRFEHARFNEKYIHDFKIVYEGAWASHDNFQSFDMDDVKNMVKVAKLIADEEFVWFAYHKDKPVAFFGMIPDWNQILKRLGGKINLWNIAKFFYYKKRKTMTRARILIMGVVPKFQGTGLESAIFWHMDKVMKRKPWYREVELSWVGDFNPKMVSIYKSVGGEHAKTHYTMRYIFDRSKPFERAPKLTSST